MSYRVAVWGVGNVGVPALRTVVAHPELELAGVIVSSADKEGRDAGDLVGLPPIGVTATRDARAVLAAGLDALVYCVNQDFRPTEAQDEIIGLVKNWFEDHKVRRNQIVIRTQLSPLRAGFPTPSAEL